MKFIRMTRDNNTPYILRTVKYVYMYNVLKAFFVPSIGAWYMVEITALVLALSVLKSTRNFIISFI